jgi:hypothetical protein
MNTSPGNDQSRTIWIIVGITAVLMVCVCVVVFAVLFGAGALSYIATTRSLAIPGTVVFEATVDVTMAVPEESGPTEDVSGSVEVGMVETYPEQSRNHIEVGESHEPYSTDPPTSGPHYAQPAYAGFYDQVIEDETLVHNLEHGHVIIWYDCSQLSEADCDTLKTQISDLIDRHNLYKLVGVPRDGMPTVLALTSWEHLMRLNEFDETAIEDYIQNYQNVAPEPNAP